jgi:hypothetical protein
MKLRSWILLTATVLATPVCAAMTKDEAIKHYGVVYAVGPYCSNVLESSGARDVLEGLGIDTVKDQESPIFTKAYRSQQKKFNEATDGQKAECKKIYGLYGPNGTAIKGYFTDPKQA